MGKKVLPHVYIHHYLLPFMSGLQAQQPTKINTITDAATLCQLHFLEEGGLDIALTIFKHLILGFSSESSFQFAESSSQFAEYKMNRILLIIYICMREII